MVHTLYAPALHPFQSAATRHARSGRWITRLLDHPPRRGGFLPTRMGITARIVLLRAAVVGGVLLPYLLVGHTAGGIGMVRQDLTLVPVALLASMLLLALDRGIPITSRTAPVMDRGAGGVWPNRTTLVEIPPAEMPHSYMPPPELATVKAFDDAVRRAFTQLADPTKLAGSPLLRLAVVTARLRAQGLEDSRLQRAAVLRALLIELLADLRPRRHEGGCIGAAWRFYNCLYYPYVQGISRRRAPTLLRELRERRERDGSPRSDLERVVAWLLEVDEDTYYKWQRRGSDTIALALRDREQAAGGSVPSSSACTPEPGTGQDARRELDA